MLTKPRQCYAPFEYQKAYDYWQMQQQAHWLHLEINMVGDITDWKLHLSESERKIIGGVLKGFVQSELNVEEYWSSFIYKVFPKPEIQLMSSTFAAMESIHAVAYAYLNQTLGLEDFDAFLYEPSAKAKIDRLILPKTKSKENIAKSLAIFSGFTEGVSLFSSFAILLNFSRFNKMKGLTDIINFSIRDESIHNEAGCWLFKTFIDENPEIWTDDLKKEIYDAARLTIQLEDNFIDTVFDGNDLEGLTSVDIKNFVRHRANNQLQNLGLKTNWKNIDMESVNKMSWFDSMSAGVFHGDFFAVRISDYSKGNINFDNMW